MRMCCSNWPIWLKTFLFVWFLATACRQAFDLIGRLWIPVFVNLIQILTCITGIFAVYQRRLALLITLSVACLFSMLYNVTLILWYNDVFGDNNRPLLTFGLPHGYSFFVQHNPLCDSYFNVSMARWTQKTGCPIGYSVFETTQAVFHIILALSTAIFSILVAKQRWNDSALKHSKAYDSRTQLTKMHIEGGETAPKPNNCRAPNSNSSTSYMNSSYENPEPLVDPQLLRKKLANSKYAKHKPPEQTENYSSAPTIELNSNTDSPSASQVEEEPKNQRLTRALPERRSCGAQLAKILDQSTDSTGRYSKIGNTSSISHSRRRSEHLLRPSASANNATMLEEAEQNPEYVEARNRIAARLANLNGDTTRNSPYHKRQGSTGNLTSLISFDPKSATLIRVQEHQNDTDDESEIVVHEEQRPQLTLQTCRSHSQDSSPAFPAPTPPKVFEHTSDSGHPTNSNNSPNWSQGGVAFPPHFNPNYMPITQSRELSLCPNSSKSPESMNYEQIGCRLISTAFPVTHTRQKSYCGVSLSTTMTLAKPESDEYNHGYQPRYQRESSPIVSTHFSRAFHDRWLSGQDQSHDDLPPPPPPTTLINSSTIPQIPSDPHIEGLLV